METSGPDAPEPTRAAGPSPAGPSPAGPSAAGPGGAHKALDEVEQIFEGGLEGDWPAKAADAIVNVVGSVRDRTTGPIMTIARGVVFGFFAAVLGVAVAVLVIIAAIRLLDEALPSGVWLAYLVLGVVFLIAGALVFRKRNQPAPAGNTTRP